MKRLILGTAGHIDHGKTSLIKALTGFDCDRLKEEKKRGITIELGFTSLKLPSGCTIGIIDVPGHEKFIKKMVSGVGGIDGIILVIAADEGIMPQTREHIDICRLLSIKNGLIAVTKADLVDEEWLGLVQEEISSYVKGSFFEGKPVVPVSAATGSGIDTLKGAIDSIISSISERPNRGIFRLPIDRVFSMKGFGTVVTGTVFDGNVAVGDEVEISPKRTITKVRNIQVHGNSVNDSSAGQRTALNLQSMEKTLIEKGDVVCHPGTLLPSSRVDAWLDYLESPGRPLKNRSMVRFHSATSETLARVILLEVDELEPGRSAFAQFTFQTPLAILPKDRFILRSLSPVNTIGGGIIIDNHALKHKKISNYLIKALETLKASEPCDMIKIFCRENSLKGCNIDYLQARTGIDKKSLEYFISKMLSDEELISFYSSPLSIILPETVKDVKKNISNTLKNYHHQNPLKTGLPKQELHSKHNRKTDSRLFDYVLEKMRVSGEIKIENEFVFIPEHKPLLSDSQMGIRQDILRTYKYAGETPPSRKELADRLKINEKQLLPILSILVQERALTKVNEELYYDAEVLQNVILRIVENPDRLESITIQDVKKWTGLSRRFIISVLEYMDRMRITLRSGDKRIIRKDRKIAT